MEEYVVYKAGPHGLPQDEVRDWVVVLPIEHDVRAREAARFYASLLTQEDPELSEALKRKCAACEAADMLEHEE